MSVGSVFPGHITCEPVKAEGSGVWGKLCFLWGSPLCALKLINKFGTCSPSSLWVMVWFVGFFFFFFLRKFLAVGRIAARV